MPIKLYFIVSLLLLLSVTNFAIASEGDCLSAETQTDMNICSAKSFEEADKKLNEVYNKGLAILETKVAQEPFRETQRAWLAYRDANCKYASSIYEGGTLAPLTHADCMQRLTEQRIEEIPNLFAEWID